MVPKVKDDRIIKGAQDKDIFKYIFENQNELNKVTEVDAERVSQKDNKINFKLINVFEMIEGEVGGNRIKETKKLYGIQNFDQAKINLDWN